LLCSLGISSGIHRTPFTCDKDVHRIACGHRTHATLAFSHLHISWIVAMVSCAGLAGNEAWTKLARTGEILSQAGRRYSRRAGYWDRLVRAITLAELAENRLGTSASEACHFTNAHN